MNEPILSVKELSKRFPSQEKPAVDSVSFDLERGRILALLGPNGAGKTTTVKMIAGLVAPSGGEVRVAGHSVEGERLAAVGQMGAVLEGARNLYWRLSAWENLLYFGSIRLLGGKQLTERARHLLALLGLDEVRDREVRTFSRGMQQKLAIGAALLHEPPLLLLDEPTLGLDLQAARTLEETVVRLAREEKRAVLLTSHQMELVERVADDLFVIDEGRRVAYGGKEEILERGNVEQRRVDIELTAPLPSEILAELQERHANIGLRDDGSGRAVLTLPVPSQAELITLLTELDRCGVGIGEVSYRRARLDEIFLSLIGER